MKGPEKEEGTNSKMSQNYNQKGRQKESFQKYKTTEIKEKTQNKTKLPLNELELVLKQKKKLPFKMEEKPRLHERTTPSSCLEHYRQIVLKGTFSYFPKTKFIGKSIKLRFRYSKC